MDGRTELVDVAIQAQGDGMGKKRKKGCPDSDLNAGSSHDGLEPELPRRKITSATPYHLAIGAFGASSGPASCRPSRISFSVSVSSVSTIH